MAGDNSILAKALETRTVLRVLSFGMIFFGLQIVLAPDHFHRTNFIGELNAASFAYLRLWGLREVLCSVLLHLISSEASDRLCRLVLVAFFLCLSPMQIYDIATRGALKEEQYWPQLATQVLFAAYMVASIVVNRDGICAEKGVKQRS